MREVALAMPPGSIGAVVIIPFHDCSYIVRMDLHVGRGGVGLDWTGLEIINRFRNS